MGYIISDDDASDVESDDDEDDTEALMAVLDQIKKEWRGSRRRCHLIEASFSHSKMIQASLSVHRPNTFKNLLSEDLLVELAETFEPIPRESFRFRDYKQLMVLSNTTTDLPDVVGQVRGLELFTMKRHKPPYLCSHSNVCLSVFAVLARLLHENLLWSCDEPKVVVATNINPKAVIHDAISATNFYFGMSMMLGKVFLSENFSETIDPSNSSVAGRNTDEDTPVKQVECTGKKPRINQVRKLDDLFNEISQIL
ncbi:hypothetical protein HID58_083179 [Brassica napus]|uniref:Uncharacterized protein n=1 Tax=Brassica napus TaxID=3708 RepID=A0ABQ7YCL9_BRANA|nr:hypothetical protein HID58_083179 [Brassica napus]